MIPADGIVIAEAFGALADQTCRQIRQQGRKGTLQSGKAFFLLECAADVHAVHARRSLPQASALACQASASACLPSALHAAAQLAQADAYSTFFP